MAHRIFLAAAAALAVFTVSGCDINTGAQKPAQSTCNCAGTPPQASVPPAPSETATPPGYHRHHHGYGRHYAYGGHDGGAHAYYWRRSYSEISVQTYDYHSSSSAYVMGEDGDREDHGGTDRHGEGYAGGAVHGEGGWVDDYGRHHDGGDATAGEGPVHAETTGDGARLHPWHGYDADCPDDRDPHRHR